jgi:hypothetical protein
VLPGALPSARPSERQQLDALQVAQPADRVNEFLIGRIVGAELEHVPLVVVRGVGARIFVDGPHLGIEFSRLDDDEGSFSKGMVSMRAPEGRLDELAYAKALVFRQSEGKPHTAGRR